MRAVSEEMAAPPATVAATTTIQDASEVMLGADSHAAVVVERGRVCGIATADAIARALAEGRDAGTTPIGAIVDVDVPVLRADEALADAHQRMRAAGRPAAPVVDGGRGPVGLLMDPEA